MTPLIDSRTLGSGLGLGLGGGDGAEDVRDADFGLMAIGAKYDPVHGGILSLPHLTSAEKM